MKSFLCVLLLIAASTALPSDADSWIEAETSSSAQIEASNAVVPHRSTVDWSSSPHPDKMAKHYKAFLEQVFVNDWHNTDPKTLVDTAFEDSPHLKALDETTKTYLRQKMLEDMLDDDTWKKWILGSAQTIVVDQASAFVSYAVMDQVDKVSPIQGTLFVALIAFGASVAAVTDPAQVKKFGKETLVAFMQDSIQTLHDEFCKLIYNVVKSYTGADMATKAIEKIPGESVFTNYFKTLTTEKVMLSSAVCPAMKFAICQANVLALLKTAAGKVSEWIAGTDKVDANPNPDKNLADRAKQLMDLIEKHLCSNKEEKLAFQKDFDSAFPAVLCGNKPCVTSPTSALLPGVTVNKKLMSKAQLTAQNKANGVVTCHMGFTSCSDARQSLTPQEKTISCLPYQVCCAARFKDPTYTGNKVQRPCIEATKEADKAWSTWFGDRLESGLNKVLG